MTQRRKITDERDARRCLAAARTAGQTAGRWAQAHGVDGRSLNAWRMNLTRGGERRPAPTRRATPALAAAPRATTALATPPRPALVELLPALAPPAARARYLVHVGAHRLELGDDFNPQTLRRLVEALRAC